MNFIAPCKRLLIVKTSSLGDIIQAFSVLDYLKTLPFDFFIDWVVEERFMSIVSAHPLVHRTISFRSKTGKRKWLEWFRELRRDSYDYVFDLQGNCKSGLLTFLSKGKVKVGFGARSVREWPNLLATNIRFDTTVSKNMRLQYIGLFQNFFQDALPYIPSSNSTLLRISEMEKKRVCEIAGEGKKRGIVQVMVCPGSRWKNKQLPLSTLITVLEEIEKKIDSFFHLIWGNQEDLELCQEIEKKLPQKVQIVEKMRHEVWQHLMDEMDLVLALDSGALHLSATTKAASFSFFGPTKPELFRPLGSRHASIRGVCPYNQRFVKQCPYLRTCSTGACIRDLKADEILHRFWSWWDCLSAKPQNRSALLPKQLPLVP